MFQVNGSLHNNNAMRYYWRMIKSFHDKRTAALFLGKRIRGIDQTIQSRVRVRLLQIDAATCLDDLRNPPSNRLERKKGKLKHLHCLRVNSQWRICFEWKNGDAYAVRVIDYH